ncbi:MAG: metallophosphoesterase [Propionicimonas sp.]
MSSRRTLLATAAAAVAMGLIGCAVVPTAPASQPATSPATESSTPTAPALSFVVGSDGHLGDPEAPGNPYPQFVATVNALNARQPLDVVILNGDLAQGGVALARQVKATLDGLAVPYVVVPGNHDELSPTQWREVWGSAPNQVRRFGARSIVLATTSNAAGELLCPDEAWLRRALAGEAGQSDVLVFLHITPKDWTRYGVDCPGVRKLFAATPNLRAVFNGHDHDQDGQLVEHGVHYLFDAHLGGHWGTTYAGFRLTTLQAGELHSRMMELDGTPLPETRISWRPGE